MSRRSLRLCTLPPLVGAGVLLAALDASAYAGRLAWTAPAECPDAGSVREGVERLLGEPLEDGDAFEASGRISADADGGFTLVLTVRAPDGSGTRTVHATRCDALASVAAFGIALALNPELDAAPPPENAENAAPGPAPAGEPARPSRPPASGTRSPGFPPPASPARAASRPKPEYPAPTLWLLAGGTLDTSLLPSPALGAAAGLDLRLLDHLRVGAEGRLFVPQLKDRVGGGGRFSLWLVDVHACVEGRLGVELAACPSFDVGTESGEGRGVAPRLTQSSRLLAPGLRVVALPELARRFSAMLGVGALFPLERDTFVVKTGPVHQIPAFSLEVLAGGAFRAL